MPTTINAVTGSFEAQGLFQIIDGATTYTVLNVEPASFEWKPGLYEPKEWKDRGVLQPPLEGDERVTTGKVTCKISTYVAAQLYAILTARGANGLIKTFQFVAKIPLNRAAVTGEIQTFGIVYLKEPPQWKAGAQFDTLEIPFVDNEVKPVMSTF